MRYAEKTKVPVSRTRDEIERTLARYGADKFIYGWDADTCQVGFRVDGVFVRLEILTDGYSESEMRQRWRVLLLLIKAKLEAIESGLSTVQEQFLADIMLSNGARVGDWIVPQLAATYQKGGMPKLLPGCV